MKWIIFIFALSFFSFSTPNIIEEETGTIKVVLTGVKPNKGIMRVAIYNKKDNFLDRDSEIMRTNDRAGNSTTQTTYFYNVPKGKIAVGCYQDVNEDWKLNGNMVGIPNEKYGFSKVPKSKWRKPRFDEVAIDYDGTETTVNIELKYWGDY